MAIHLLVFFGRDKYYNKSCQMSNNLTFGKFLPIGHPFNYIGVSGGLFVVPR